MIWCNVDFLAASKLRLKFLLVINLNDAVVSSRRHLCYPTEDAQNQRKTKSNCKKPPKRRWWVEQLRNSSDSTLTTTSWLLTCQTLTLEHKMQSCLGNKTVQLSSERKKGIYLESSETLLAAADLGILDRFLSPQNINLCSAGKSN